LSPFLKITLGFSLTAFFVSCAAPPVGSWSGRDVYGHRPGPKGFKTVIIDAGHGGKDSGATSRVTGQKEKGLALDTAKRIANDLRRDFRVVMMRSDDPFVDLDERVSRANRYGAAILVSMHYNSGPSAIRPPRCGSTR
jgi:N-acetylmuramoyl-L-alanine amidase